MIARVSRRLRLRGEEGFTLIEVLVAAFILVLGALAVFMTFAAGVKNVQRSRDTQIAISVAQREMEKIQSLPYERIVMASTPVTSTESGSPAERVSGTNYNLKRTGTAELAPLAVAAAGLCTATNPCVNAAASSSCVSGSSPGTFSNGSAVGSVYCYVTTRSDAACETASGKTCSYKRIVVAVWLNKPSNQSQRSPYYELQSSVNPPS